jgi:hypothetical protein
MQKYTKDPRPLDQLLSHMTSGGGNCVIHTFFFGVHGGAVMEVSCAVARFLFSNCGRDSDSLKKQHKNLST